MDSGQKEEQTNHISSNQSTPTKPNGNSADELKLDQIEVSLVDDAVGEPGEALANAKDFLVEENENFRPTWAEASERTAESMEDPSKPPVPGANLAYIRFRLRRIVESIPFRLLTLILIAADIAVVVAELCLDPYEDQAAVKALRAVDFAFTIYFVVEIGLRITALTQPVFFAQWYNVVDFAVVLSTLVIVITVHVTNSAWVENLALFKVSF